MCDTNTVFKLCTVIQSGTFKVVVRLFLTPILFVVEEKKQPNPSLAFSVWANLDKSENFIHNL